MILESMVALIGVLAVQVGKDIASNIENRIINAAIDVANQKQQPQLSELNFGIRTLQKTQDEMKENQRREIKVHYKNGIDFMRYANAATNSKQKKHFIHNAIESFTYASNVEVGEATVHARVLVGACFFALRSLDSTTPIDLENGEYEKAFQLAEKTLVYAPYPRLQLRGLKPLPSRELIQQLLKVPYLQQKYGTFGVYWKKWEPPKPVAPPKIVGAQPGIGYTVIGSQRTCVSCGKPFSVSSRPLFMQPYCPECSLKLPGNTQKLLLQTKQLTIRKICQKCHKQYDEPIRSLNLKNYCPECRRKYPDFP